MPHSMLADHDEPDDHDLILLAEVPAHTFVHVEERRKPQRKNVSIDTIETDSHEYDFDIAYGRADPDDLSLSNVPIIRMKEEDYESALEHRGSSGNNRWKILAGCALCLLLLIAIIVGAVVGSNAGAPQGSEVTAQSVAQETLSISPSEAPMLRTETPTVVEAPIQPTGTPTVSRAPSKRSPFQIVADALSLNGDKLPVDPETSQFKALSFLTVEYSESGDLLSTDRLERRYALACIYFALGGENWKDQLAFLSTQHECDWRDMQETLMKGVICGENNAINYLSLPSNNLSGTIPPEIGYISSLQHLDLSFNNIGGRIPIGLQSAKGMVRLSLNSNELTGTIPTFVSTYGWRNLTFLSVEENLLIGDMSSFCALDEAIFRADCYGDEDAQISCPCCYTCCAKNKTCYNV